MDKSEYDLMTRQVEALELIAKILRDILITMQLEREG